MSLVTSSDNVNGDVVSRRQRRWRVTNVAGNKGLMLLLI